MFGRKNTISSVVTEALKDIKPEPREVHSPLDDNELKAHIRVTEALGYEPPALLEAKLLNYFKENGIKVYDYNSVFNYLKGKAEAQGKKFIWRPLRPQDTEVGYSWGGFNEHGSYHKHWDYRPYTHAVPLRVLATVEKIVERFGNKVKFFVSDYAVPRPDPFIMVTALDVSTLVFDYWDEPDFKG